MEQTMPAELAENLIDFCENRRRVYALVARCYEREMDGALAAELAEHAALESDDAQLAQAFAALKDGLSECGESQLEQLAVAFNRVFFGMGPRSAQKAFPYESVYTSERGLMMQEAYSAVLHVYREEGFAKNPDFTEPEDHLAVELSFMAALCDRAVRALRAGDEAGAERALRRQAEFLQQHLLNWVDPFIADMKRADEGGFYERLATFTEAYVRADADAVAEVLA